MRTRQRSEHHSMFHEAPASKKAGKRTRERGSICRVRVMDKMARLGRALTAPALPIMLPSRPRRNAPANVLVAEINPSHSGTSSLPELPKAVSLLPRAHLSKFGFSPKLNDRIGGFRCGSVRAARKSLDRKRAE